MTEPRRVYLDTEFIASDPSTAGLISIGLTDDQGRDYYAVNGDINPTDVQFHPWLSKHVWPYLPKNEAGFTLVAAVRRPPQSDPRSSTRAQAHDQ